MCLHICRSQLQLSLFRIGDGTYGICLLHWSNVSWPSIGSHREHRGRLSDDIRFSLFPPSGPPGPGPSFPPLVVPGRATRRFIPKHASTNLLSPDFAVPLLFFLAVYPLLSTSCPRFTTTSSNRNAPCAHWPASANARHALHCKRFGWAKSIRLLYAAPGGVHAANTLE